MQIGVDSFAAAGLGTTLDGPISASRALNDLVEQIVEADRVGLDVFGVGEHHRRDFLDSAAPVILGAAATRTSRIRLASAVTVLSAADPVRVFQSFATLDLLSGGRAEIVAGRGSFGEAFPLFGLRPQDYDSLFTENLELLLTIRDNEHVRWTGKHRAPLTGQGVYPRPFQKQMPIWLGVGGTPSSFARAGSLGLPLVVAIIGGETHRFRPLIDIYREYGRKAGFGPERLSVAMHSLGFVAPTAEQAHEAFYPGYVRSTTEIGKERGWAPMSRAQYNAQTGPLGALLVGSPQDVADKVVRHSEALGGLDRVTFQMSVSALPAAELISAIQLLGAEVKPLVTAGLQKKQTASKS